MFSKLGLNYEIIGSQSEKKLVFLHGLMGSLNNWRSVARHFAKEFEVLLLDQRGHGKSFHPSEGYSPEHYADDLLSLLEELGWDKVHLVGHSMGGRNALVFSHRFSTRVRSLVVEDISVELRPDNSTKIEQMILRVPVPFESRQEAKAYFDGPFIDSLKDSSKAKELSLYMLSNISERQSQGGLSWRFCLEGVLESLAVGRNRDFWFEWQQINLPVLLIKGDHSTDLDLKDFDAMLSKNSLAQGQIILNAGHWVHYDALEEFVLALRSFYEPLTSSVEVG